MIRSPTPSTASAPSPTVLQLLKLPDGTVKVLVEGRARADIDRYHGPRRILRGRGPSCWPSRKRTRSRSRRWRARWSTSSRTTSSSTRRFPPKSSARSGQIENASKLADTIASAPRPSRSSRSRKCWRPPIVNDAPAEGLGLMEGEIGPAGRKTHPLACQAPDGEDPARILSQRADEGDPEGAGRRRGRPRRDHRAGRTHRQDQALQGSPRPRPMPS